MYIAYRSIPFKLRAYRLFKECDKLYVSTIKRNRWIGVLALSNKELEDK